MAMWEESKYMLTLMPASLVNPFVVLPFGYEPRACWGRALIKTHVRGVESILKVVRPWQCTCKQAARLVALVQPQHNNG